VVLRSGTRLATDFEQATRRAIADGTLPYELAGPFDDRMRAYAAAVAAAAAQLETRRVRTPAEFQAVLDPVVAQLQRLADLIEDAAEVRSPVWTWFEALRDVQIDGFNEAVGEPLFGAPRFPL
jgi:hypothetical protein